MSSVYPRAAVVKDVTPMDQAVLAQNIIAAREADPDKSKAQIIGGVLDGSDDVAGFEQAWDAVEAERIAMAGVSVVDSSTRVDYEAELTKVATHLDARLYADGVLDEALASTWNVLQDKLSPVEV